MLDFFTPITFLPSIWARLEFLERFIEYKAYFSVKLLQYIFWEIFALLLQIILSDIIGVVLNVWIFKVIPYKGNKRTPRALHPPKTWEFIMQWIYAETFKTTFFALFRQFEFWELNFQNIDAILYYGIFGNGDLEILCSSHTITIWI